MSAPAWAGDVLRFWFGLREDDWFAVNATLDTQIRERFLPLHAQLMAEDAASVIDAATARAAIIVLDQFSRNMFRGQPRAFASDPLARQLARLALAQGWDQGLRPEERLFLSLPFEHSEDSLDQAMSVALVSSLGNESWIDFARRHQALIARFGRFPHRNAILGRDSSAEELALLAIA